MNSPGSIGLPYPPSVDSKCLIGTTVMEKPADTAIFTLSGEGVAFQRNAIARSFVGDWLLFIDADMIPAPDALTRLLAHGDLDIVHAVCCQRFPPYKFCTFDLDGKRLKPPLGRTLIEAESCGMAFTLIRRRVFEAMTDPWFEVGKHAADPTALFEDIWFCWKARQHGFRIWADPTVTVWHLAQHAVAPGPDGFPHVRCAAETIPYIPTSEGDEDAHPGRQSAVPPQPAPAV